MRHIYIILLVASCFSTFGQIDNVVLRKGALGKVELTGVKQGWNSSSTYSKEQRNEETIHQKIEKMIRNHEWQLIASLFASNSQYERLMSQLTYSKKDLLALDKSVENTSVLYRIKPWRIQSVNGNEFILKTVNGREQVIINFSISNQLITNVSVQASNLRVKAGTDGETWNFVQLASYDDGEEQVIEPTYFEDYYEFYTKNKSVDNIDKEAEFPFGQIEFEPLEFEYRACSFGVCKNGIYKYKLGNVISDKDMLENQQAYIKKYFRDVTDMAAFVTPFSADYLLFDSYTITAVVVDKLKKQLTFLRDGLEPWVYGKGDSDFRFENPIAIEEVGQVLYVLDAGINPTIQVLKVVHSAGGEISIEQKGTINTIQLDNPSDVGGFESQGKNFLYVSDYNGLHVIELNQSTGLPSGVTKLFTTAIDPNDSQKQINLNRTLRVSADKSSGSTVLLLYNNEIVSFSNTVVESQGSSNEVNLNFRISLSPEYDPTNLAYMRFEKKWYITDNTGKLHVLDKNGKHISTGGKLGKGEWGGELYYPRALTPNKIDDPTNDYRYRFIVANTYGWETGFKLFAPRVIIPDFEVFENLNNNELTFTFTTSGKWQHVEKGTGLTFSGLKINGQAVDENLWNAQIVPGTVENPGDQLNDKINEVLLQPAQITSLRRGWNAAEVNVTIFKKDGNPEIVKKTIDFYWLPTNYNAAAQSGGPLANNNWQLNLYSTIGSEKIDFIYKDISLESTASFYGVGRSVVLMPLCTLTVIGGNTLYNESPGYDPLQNFSFGEGSLIDIRQFGYICLNVDRTTFDITQKNYQNHLKLDDEYRLDVYPSNVPEYANAACKSPCEVMEARSPQFDFKLEIDRTSPTPQLLITPNSTYREALHISFTNLTTQSTSSREIDANAPETLNLGVDIFQGYPINACAEYEVALSMGCNGFKWPISKTKTINTSPEVDAGEDVALCYHTSGSKILEPKTPESGGVWSSNDLTITSGGEINYADVQVGVNYVVTYSVTDQWSCTVSDDLILTMKPQVPVVSITSEANVCEEAVLTLNATAMEDVIYVWTLPSGERLATSTSSYSLADFSNDNIGAYQASIYVEGCEGDLSSPFSVGMFEKTLVDAGADVKLCGSESAHTLSSGTPAGGVWSGENVTTNMFDPSLVSTGKHEVTYTYVDANNCEYSDTKEITVGPLHPMPETFEICQTDNAIYLPDFIPNSSNWSGQGVISNVFVPEQTYAGIKTLHFDYTEGGCSTNFNLTVLVKPGPLYLELGPGIPVCPDEFPRLTATSFEGATYSWTGPNDFTSNNPSPIVVGEKEAIEGTYYLTVSIGECSVTSNTILSILEKEEVTINNNTKLCASDLPLTLSATPATGVWSGQGVTLVGSDYQFDVEDPIGLHSLSYTTTDANNCENRKSVYVKVETTPLAVVEMSKLLGSCYNEVDEYQLFARVVNPQEETFKWYRSGVELAGETTQALNVTDVETYTLEMTNSCGTRTQAFTPPLNISPIFSAIPSSFVCDGNCAETITVNVENLQLGNDYEFKLLKNGALVQEVAVNEVTASDATHTFALDGSGSYTVLVKNNNDFGVCEVSKEVTIDRKEVAQEGRYFSFNEGDRVYAPHIDAYDFHQGAHTFEAWIQIPEGYLVNPNYNGGGNEIIMTIFGTQTYFDPVENENGGTSGLDNNYNGYSFGINEDGIPQIRARHQYIYWNQTNSFSNLKDGKCHHIAMVRRIVYVPLVPGSPWTNYYYNVHDLYVDGEFIGSKERGLSNGGQGTTMFDLENGDLFFGFNTNHTYGGYSFEGYIKETRLWNIERSAEQIKNNYEFPLDGDEAGLVGYWKFNETDGSQTITDYSPYANHAIVGKTTSIETQDPAFEVGCEPQCEQVSGLEQVDLTKTTATLGWEGSTYANYQLRYREQGTEIWDTVEVFNQTKVAISNLIEGTLYEWEVRIVCEEGVNYSDWSERQTYTTLGKVCEQPVNLTSQVYSDNVVELKWENEADVESYQVRYKAVDEASWTLAAVAEKRLIITGSALSVATTYDWTVVSVCETNHSSLPNEEIFTTKSSISCGTPQNMQTTNLTESSTVLKWVGSPEKAHRIRYNLTINNTWYYKMVPAGENSVLITGLAPASNYRWQVLTLCDDGSFMPANFGSAPYKFFTSGGEPCPIPTGLQTYVALDNTTTLSWSPMAVPISYRVKYNHTVNNTWTYKLTNTTEYTIPGNSLVEGSTYRWAVQAYCEYNISDESNRIMFTTNALSGTRESMSGANDEFLVEIAPNPFMEELNVRIYSGQEEEIKIQLIDLNGVVHYDEVRMGSGEVKIQNDLSAGVYYLKTINKRGEVKMHKIVKM